MILLPGYGPQVWRLRKGLLPEARNSECIFSKASEQICAPSNCQQQINRSCPGSSSSDATAGRTTWVFRTRVHETTCQTRHHIFHPTFFLPNTIPVGLAKVVFLFTRSLFRLHICHRVLVAVTMRRETASATCILSSDTSRGSAALGYWAKGCPTAKRNAFLYALLLSCFRGSTSREYLLAARMNPTTSIPDWSLNT